MTQGELTCSDGTACTGRTITVNAGGQIVGQTLAGMDAFAIHAQARLCAAAVPAAGFAVTIAGAATTCC